MHNLTKEQLEHIKTFGETGELNTDFLNAIGQLSEDMTYRVSVIADKHARISGIGGFEEYSSEGEYISLERGAFTTLMTYHDRCDRQTRFDHESVLFTDFLNPDILEELDEKYKERLAAHEARKIRAAEERKSKLEEEQRLKDEFEQWKKDKAND